MVRKVVIYIVFGFYGFVATRDLHFFHSPFFYLSLSRSALVIVIYYLRGKKCGIGADSIIVK